MRVGEMHSLEWRDVDVDGNPDSALRVGKSAGARRWVAVPPELMAEIDGGDTAQRSHPRSAGFRRRDTERRQERDPARACKAAGIAHYHPHDLRHRSASVQIARGVPVTLLAAQLGHSPGTR